MRDRSILKARLAIGFVQGLLLWLLSHAAQVHGWPATTPYLFVPLVLGGFFVPIIAVAALGNLRPVTHGLWLVVATAVVGAIGLHQVWRDRVAGYGLSALQPSSAIPAIVALAAALFVLHVLVVAADADRRPVAAYPTYFEAAWKHQVQLLMSLGFEAAFWGVLWLGAGLFALIGISLPAQLLLRPWFIFPASTLAFAWAVHVTDVRAGLVQGMRNLLHVLLSWLLPIATVLILAFIAALPFTGLAPLWKTGHGSELVLATVAVLVLLINTAYRDGTESGPPASLRWAGTAAALCLPVLVAISAYGLGLRIEHRGWTSYRVVGVAALVVAGCYALGYACAAVASRRWLKGLEATNIIAAILVIAAVLGLTSPLADPARLSVPAQVARLLSGRASPEAFEFNYLRFNTGRYGREALAALRTAEGPNGEAIRQRAERALAAATPYAARQPVPPSRPELGAIPVFPAGHALPEAFVAQDWAAPPRRYALPQCLVNADVKCEAFVTEIDGTPALLVLELSGARRGIVFQQDAAAGWRVVGPVSDEIRCDSVRQALRSGDYRWVPVQSQELEAAGERLAVLAPRKPATCR